jgi:MATE family multidrug resistance protein
MLAMVPMAIASVLRSFIAALGRPLYATLINAAMIGVNALGNYVLIYGKWGAPELGLNGSAVSTVITAWAFVAAYVVAICADRRLRRYRVFGRLWRPEWDRLRALWRIGLPVAVTIVAEAGIFNAAAFMMGAISPLALASHTLALQIAAIAFQVPFGVGQAATIRVGYFFGAGDRAAIARAGWVAIGTGSAFMLLTAGAMLFAPRALIGLYVDVDDPANAAMVALSLKFMLIAAAFQLADGTQAVALGALRGLQDTRLPMAIALFGYWVPGLACCLALGFLTPLAGLGVWMGLALGLLVVAAMLLHRWMRREALGLVLGHRQFSS